ncbi:IS1380-Spn1 transposase [Streptococcus pneumoniae]|nr:IS1380-Spn1 transposase [Streptococcus pneumoniae]
MNQKLTGFVYGVDASSMFSQAMSLLQKGLIAVGAFLVVMGIINLSTNIKPQLFTPNLKIIQNPCLSLDPGWFLFSPNGCFLLDKKEFPLYGISVEKKHKKKGTQISS